MRKLRQLLDDSRLLRPSGDTVWNQLVDPYRRMLRRDRYALHYIDMGQGEPVVLLHGYADSCYSWHATIGPLVTAGYRVILVDQFGLGRSSPPPPPCRLSVERQADDVLRLCDQLGLEQFHLVGHSMGGGIVLYLCLEHPERIRSAVTLAPLCRKPKQRPLLSYPGIRLLAETVPNQVIFHGGLRMVYRNRAIVQKPLVAEYVNAAARRDFWATLARLTREFFSDGFNRMPERYASLSPRLLIVWGKTDRWLPERLGRWLSRKIPKARYVVVPDAGHNLHQERPKAINNLLLDFFSKTETL